MAERFQTFAELECGGAPLYRELATFVAGDAELLSVAARAVHGPAPNLFLAAVHDLLMRAPDVELAAYYPTLTAEPRDPSDAGPALRAFVLENRAEIERLLRFRLVQTNEVRRSLALYLAAGWLIRRAGVERVAVIEVGCSAGLLLAFDRYAYRVRPGTTLGDASSPLVLDGELRGEMPDAASLDGRIVERIGVDLNTLDLTDPEDRRWLRALVWGDQPERLALLDRAIEVAREIPMALHQGDGNALLPGILAGLDASLAPVVYHSHALNQFPPGARERFEAVLATASEARDVYRIAMEYVDGAPHVDLLIYRRGALDEHIRLARYDAHGAWVAWLTSSGGR